MLYNYSAIILRVIDGDTLHVRIDLGFHVHVEQTLRLAGINAPELSTVAGQNARNEVVRRIEMSGNVVRIETKKNPGDRYGRWLATVWCKPPLHESEYSLNLWLIDHGFAEPYNP